MENFESMINEKISDKNARAITAVTQEGDTMAELLLYQFIANDAMMARMEKQPNPLRAFSPIGGVLLGCTERLKSQEAYYKKFIEMAKGVGLDKNFEIYSLGNSLGKQR